MLPLEAVQSGSPWLEVLGHLHPLVVHFPIALLLSAALIELLGGTKRGPVFVRATLLCLALGTLGALLTATSGWFLAEFRSVPARMQSTLLWHRWGGVGVAGTALLALIAGALVRGRSAGFGLVVYRGLLLALGLTTGIVAHLGGNLTWGSDWLTEPLLRAVSQVSSSPQAAAPAAAPSEAESSAAEMLSIPPAASPLVPEPAAPLSPEPAAPGQAPEALASVLPKQAGSPSKAGEHALPSESPVGVNFERDVLPLLSAHCIECHGPNKSKAELRLDSLAQILAGDPMYWVVDPGHPDSSLMIERVALPDDDPDRMPPKGERLLASEVQLLREWIQSLQVPSGPQGEAPQPVSQPIAPKSAALVAPGGPSVGFEQPGSELERASSPLPPADPAVVARWVERGARVLPLAAGDGALELSLARRGTDFDPAWLLDLAPLSQQLVWLDLSNTAVRDGDLSALGGLTHLESLRLDGTLVTSAGLPALAELPRLLRLNLCSTPVDAKALPVLAEGFAALQRLYLWNSRFPLAAAEALAARRPKLELGPLGAEALAETQAGTSSASAPPQ